MKKKFLTTLLSFVALLVVIAGLELQQRWKEYQEQQEEKYDGRPLVFPSPTSYPRLAESERQARLVEFFQSNGGCRFPCWWGIVPGKTRWEEVHALLTPFMDSDTNQYLSDDGVFFTSGYYYDFPSHIAIEEELHEDGRLFRLLIEDIPPEYLSNLKLSNIFETYGKPGEIYIRSPHWEFADRSCLGEFELFLYYPRRQFAVRYRYFSHPLKRTIQVCGLDQPDLAEFYLWGPVDFHSFQEAVKFSHWYTDQEQVRSLEEATDWTIESFYTAIQSQGEAGVCIVAPPYRWKYAAGNGLYSWCDESSP